MRHAFRFPYEVQVAVRNHVRNAIGKVSPERFRQEHAYTTALVSALEGTAYDGPAGFVGLKSTIVDDRGPGAAERWSGIDFAITADISDPVKRIEKAIVFQSKRGDIEALTTKELP